jgi:hypothetical protein
MAHGWLNSPMGERRRGYFKASENKVVRGRTDLVGIEATLELETKSEANLQALAGI